jgi:hypothetical protein
VNDDGLRDEDGDASDWFEVENQDVSSVNLDGWYATDDPGDLTRWRFPPVVLGGGEFLIVFASGKDRAVAGSPLHASFGLDGGGEFLALVMPDGHTIAHAYTPAYPEQHEDFSYGIAQSTESAALVATGAEARVRVPASGADGLDWTLPSFEDAAWTLGPTGVGYDTDEDGGPPGQGENIAPTGTASQSSEYAGGQFPASLAIDGNLGNFTHTLTGQGPASWELDLGRTARVDLVRLHNRTSCCGSRLRDVRISILDAARQVAYQSVPLNPENALGSFPNGPASLTLDLIEETGGAVPGRYVQVVREPDPDLSGTGGQGNADEAHVLSLAEVQVFERPVVGYHSLIATDIEGAMLGASSTAYIRVPFELATVPAFDLLKLRMRYDDGFVAYLNGREVARRNAPALPAWDSAASAEREDADAISFEEIVITADQDALLFGPNVLAIHGLNDAALSTDFLIGPELVGQTILDAAARYFESPTPGTANDPDGVVGFVADTRFSHDRGVYEAPIAVTITTATEDAVIRYTTNGAPPTTGTGTVYSAPVLIDRTTVLSVRAFKDGYEPTDLDTQTYIFLEDVIRQSPASTIAQGFPASWNGTAPDYGMDPDVVGQNGEDRYGGEYAATIREDLLSIPSMSIVLRTEDMFGASGIYSNPGQGGVAWERPCSMELIYPGGVSPRGDPDGFQASCGIRIQGGAFRSFGLTRKKSFRLLFKGIYGPTKLRYPIFGKEFGDSFDTITLRGGANDGYSWADARLTEQYIRDELGRRLQLATRSAAAVGTLVHLYVNGVYWGLYNPVVRPDHSFSASQYGGRKEDWDSVHDLGATNGSLDAWNQMLGKAAQAAGSLAAYQELQGRSPDGTPNPAFPHLLDVPNYADYLIVNLWGGNWDWPWKNWWAGRDRTAASTGFKFYSWDYENTIGNNRSRSPLNMNALNNNFSSAGVPHQSLRGSPEYRLLFADRVHRLFANGGILTPAALAPRYQALAAWVERAIVAESARWGDQHYATPLTLSEWRTERSWILGTYIPQRSDIVLAQFRAAGLYPAVVAPSFNTHGGRVPEGFELLVTAPAGTVYYALDGADPRLPGGGVAPAAREATSPVVIDRTTIVKARARSGSDWSALNEAFFHLDIPLRITEVMYHPGAPGGGSSFDADDFEFLELQNIGVEPLSLAGFRLGGGIAFDFPSLVVAPGEVFLVVENLEAFVERYPFLGVTIAGEYAGNLSNAGDSLLLEGPAGEPLLAFAFSDAWRPETDGEGYSLVIADTGLDPDVWGEAESWLASDDAGGSPGIIEADLAGGRQIPGNLNQDEALDIADALRLLRHLFPEGAPLPLPCDGESITTGANRILADVNGDLDVDITDALDLLNYLVLNGKAPSLGTRCVRIEGCDSVCSL